MNFAILTQYYPPEIGAPQARLSFLAKRFVERGHQVTVMTAMPNYPTGHIHDGYGGLLRREERDGVAIVRTCIYPTRRTAMVPRLANYCSFVASSSVLVPWLIQPAHYLLVESPPLFLGPAGLWLSWCARSRCIFNVSDLWPESAVRLGVLRPESLAYRIASEIEAFCYRKAWLVTGQSKSIIASINERFPNCPTFHLSNGVDTNQFGPDKRSCALHGHLAGGRETVVLYAGLHGLAQGLNQLVAAAAALSDDAGLRFVLVGDGPEKPQLVADVAQRRLDNVAFLDPRPFAEMPSLVASADIVVVCLKMDIPGAVPSKLYEAMASGRAVILIATGEPAEIVREHGAGIVVAPGDIDGLVRAVRELRVDPNRAQALGACGRRAAQSHFNRDAICARFIDHLEQEVGR